MGGTSARARAAEADHHVRSIKRAQRRNLERARFIELQEAWERRDFAATWKLTRILTEKELDQRNAVLPLHRLHRFVNRNGWHTLRDQAVKEAALLHLWTYLKQDMYQQQQQTTLTQRIGHELLNHVFENALQEHPFAKLTQRGLCLVHYGDCWSIQMRLKANNVTASALNNVRHAQTFLTRFFALWFGTVSRRTPRSWHVSQSFTLSKNNNKSGISGLRLVDTLDTAGKEYYSQLWKLVTHSWQRDYATGFCHRRRREQAIAQNGVLRERYRAAKKNFTAVLYDLTNAFACGAQESQAGDPASLADVVRAEVKNLAAREHLCQRLASAQLRLDCADGQLAAKIGSGTLPGDSGRRLVFTAFPPKT